MTGPALLAGTERAVQVSAGRLDVDGRQALLVRGAGIRRYCGGVKARQHLVLAVTAAFVLAGCGAFENDLGPRDINRDGAESALSELRISVPEGARFIAGIESPPGFVGSSSYYIRFGTPGSTPTTVAALNTANGFGDIHRIACPSPLLTNESLQKIGLQCDGVREVSVIRTDNEPAEQTLTPGREAIAVVNEGSSATQLFVIAEGT